MATNDRLLTADQMLTGSATEVYRAEMLDALKLSFPFLTEGDINEAIDYSIRKRAQDSQAVIDNNYKNTREKTTLYRITDYFIEREPVVTVAGVVFKKHGEVPNPFVMLIQEFLNSRGMYKKEMFKYPKGSEDFEKYNILQLSEKVSGNAMYGASGNHTSVFYNLYVAQSITMQGRSCIAAAIMLFEATMANNVKFCSLNDVVTFINNVRREPDRKYPQEVIIDPDKYVNVEEVLFKIFYSCGFYWIPTEKELTLIYDMIAQLNQRELNKLFYKNNLYWFVENSVVNAKIVEILSSLDTPFLDPNSPPDSIKDLMDELYDMIFEWVYYDKQYCDRIDRAENMIRYVSMLTDTDSCFISFDGWYRYILNKTFNIPMRIKEIDIDEKTGEVSEAFDKSLDYNFYTDEIIESSTVIRPDVVLPQVGFRCSIINILASIMGKLAIDYMGKYSDNSNTTTCYDGSKRKSFFILKNEFQLKRALITMNKKNYCAYQERQEGSIIPKAKALDIKGMPLKKTGVPDSTKVRLQKILLDMVLDNPNGINQIEIVKQLAILEKQIVESIRNGSKEYFKPERIKAIDAYETPMRESGIKASIAYNALKDDVYSPIDLSGRNSILNVKVDINPKNVVGLMDTYPDVYAKALELMKKKEYSKGITGIALEGDTPIPEWMKDYIDYTTIVNDNLHTFPLEPLGINRRDNDRINYTNILKF